MKKYKNSEHRNVRIKKGKSQYDWNEIADNTMVDAVYVNVPGHEDNLCLSALPAREDYEPLGNKLTMLAPHYEQDEINRMTSLEKKRALKSIKNIIFPLSHFYDMYEMIYDCLWETYDYRNEWEVESIPPDVDKKWMEKKLKSKPDKLKGRAPFFAVVGASGSGKTLACEQVLRTIPKAIRHKTDSMEFVQIPVLKATVTAGNLSGILDILAMKLDEILDTGSYHSDQMRKKKVFDGCLLLIKWVNDYNIGMLLIDEAQFLDFGNKSTSIENLIIVAEEAGCSIGLIGNDEIMLKLEKYPRFLTRIGSNRLNTKCTTKHSKRFLLTLLATLWEYNFTKEDKTLSNEVADTFLSESLYNASFLKNLVMMVQLEAITRKPKDGITPEYIRHVCTKHFAELQGTLYLNTPESDRKAMALLSEAEQKLDDSIQKEQEKKKGRLLRESQHTFDSATMSKFNTVYEVLTQCRGYQKNEVKIAFRNRLNADKTFQDQPMPKILDTLDKLLGTTMPDRKVKTPSRNPVSEKEVIDIEEVLGLENKEEEYVCND